MLNYEDAYKIILENFHLIEKNSFEINLIDSLNYILAEDVMTDINHPPFTNSAMDGFAVKYDLKQKNWVVIGEISAGNFFDYNPDYHHAVSIMTGGRIPENIDTVIPMEDLIVEGDNLILKSDCKVKKWQNIRFKGNDLEIGKLAVAKNTLINSKNIGLLAACGKSKIKVYKPLKIGILTSGDELIDINSFPENDKIRSSNLYALITQVKQINMIPLNFGIIKDDVNILSIKVQEALNSDIDILITSGGVSVGKHDYIKEVLLNLGVNIKFWKANIKPGKPILFSTFSNTYNNKLIFSLPGNPLSCFVNFEIFIKRAIYEYFKVNPNIIQIAESESNLNKKDNKLHFVIGNLLYNKEKRKMTAIKSNNQSSGNIYSLNNSNCFIVFPENKNQIEKGEMVECIMI